jgi:hypothetical protein
VRYLIVKVRSDVVLAPHNRLPCTLTPENVAMLNAVCSVAMYVPGVSAGSGRKLRSLPVYTAPIALPLSGAKYATYCVL